MWKDDDDYVNVIKILLYADTWSLQDDCHPQDVLKLVEGT
jgi:hypothetical protein